MSSSTARRALRVGGPQTAPTGASAGSTQSPPPVPRTLRNSRTVRISFLLVAVLVCAWVSIALVDSPSQVPAIWPAGGLLAGLLLTSPRMLQRWLLGASFLLMGGVYVSQGYDLLPAFGYGLTFTGAAWLVRRRLLDGLGGRHAALRDSGDVSRLVGAIAAGSLLAGAGYGLTNWAVGQGDPVLGALGAFSANAAAMMVLLPLFVQTVSFEALAGPRERVIQAALTIGTTLAVFLVADIPPVVFAVMPMFAWHAFRGTLREATLLLTVVAVIGSTASAVEIGPVHGLAERYGLPAEVVASILQLFLLDCALILLPLSVMVTQQRMSAARAAAERETLRRLVESATGTAIIAMALDGSVTLFNPGAELMLGYSSKEVLGRHAQMFHPRGELRRQAEVLGVERTFTDLCQAAAQSPEPHLWRFVRKDGEERTVRLRLNAVSDESESLSGYLATAEDVTEREAAQQALLLTLEHQRTAVERLEELERVKSDFVATVSHELRTPIASILGYAELLDDGLVGDLSASQSEIVDRVDRNGRRLLLLVEDLLTLSQIESSSLRIEPVATDIGSVVGRAREGLGPLLANRALHVEVEIPEEPVVHHGDPVQLERMLANLMSNAVKFTPDGGRVRIALHSEGETSRIVVQDNGVGISEDDQSKLFTRFFRSSSSFDRAVQGAGLGLTIVQAIVALHGGRVGITSTHGQGTTVTVILPRVPPATD